MDDLRQFIYWIKEERQLSDRTINACISQLRFFTLYVLHKPWDPSQLPINSERSHPFVPEKKNTSPIQISAVSPRLGTILKNHIQSNSVIFQSCSFCLLWIWYFTNEFYHSLIVLESGDILLAKRPLRYDPYLEWSSRRWCGISTGRISYRRQKQSKIKKITPLSRELYKILFLIQFPVWKKL